MALLIKKVKKAEIAELKQLFENSPDLSEFNPFKTGTDEEFEWQFFCDAYNTSTYIAAVDTDKGDIIGTISALLIPMISPEREKCLTIKPEDALVSIKGLIRYRNRDILKEMFDRMIDENSRLNVTFLWGFTHSVSSFERLGFTHEITSKQGIYVIHPFRSYIHLSRLNSTNRIKQKIEIGGLSLIACLKGILFTKKIEEISLNEINLHELDEELLLSWLPEHLYCICLDKHFLNWRIVQNPSDLQFFILQFKNLSGQTISYMICSRKDPFVYFIEQMIFSNLISQHEKKKIILRALQYFRRKNASIVRFMGFDHNYANRGEITFLKKAGFLFLKRGIPFIFMRKEMNIKPDEIYLSRLNTQGTF